MLEKYIIIPGVGATTPTSAKCDMFPRWSAGCARRRRAGTAAIGAPRQEHHCRRSKPKAGRTERLHRTSRICHSRARCGGSMMFSWFDKKPKSAEPKGVEISLEQNAVAGLPPPPAAASSQPRQVKHFLHLHGRSSLNDAEAAWLFNFLRDDTGIPWTPAVDGCWERAHAMASFIQQTGTPVRKVWVFSGARLRGELGHDLPR